MGEPSRLLGAQEAARLLGEAKKTAAEEESGEAVRLAAAYHLRGWEHFRLGKIDESVQDFEQLVRMRPDLEPHQWELGISYYYAGQFEKGARQFELYQYYDDNDVENSVWRYLCVARREGIQKAGESPLPIQHDPRVPMMQIYDLFRARLSPAEVLKAAHADSPGAEDLKLRRFYAQLYIGLFYDAEGNQKLAREHIVAAEQHRLSHYMWDVAGYHATLLRQQK